MTPYPEQLTAAKIAAERHRGIITATTGSGKSLIAALIIEKLQVRTLIVVPSLELKSQLTGSMANWFGAEKIGKNKDIWIENIQALSPTKIILGYDLLIIDEFHHSAASQYRRLNKVAWENIYYRIGLSATPFRSDSEESILLESILSEVIFTISYKTAVKNKMVVPLEAYYIESPKQKTDAFTYAQVYGELVVNNIAKNTMLAKLLTSLHSSGKSTLCLVKEIAHGEAIQELTGLPFVNGQDINSRKHIKRFNEGALKVLIGTTGVLSEGVDTRACEYVVIAGSGKAKSQFMQACGRGMRNFPGKDSAKVILIKDKSHKYLMRHFSAQLKILLAEYGAIPVKLEV